MDTAQSDKVLSKMDTVGACLSFACAVHCIAMPFVITILALIGLGMLTHHGIDTVMFVVTITLATLSLCWGMYIHRRIRVLFFLVAAITLFYLGGFSIHGKHEALYVAFGGCCLALGHVVNRRLCRSCVDCCEHENHQKTASSLHQPPQLEKSAGKV